MREFIFAGNEFRSLLEQPARQYQRNMRKLRRPELERAATGMPTEQRANFSETLRERALTAGVDDGSLPAKS